jgi:NAD dependent epimerase/dehydratase family
VQSSAAQIGQPHNRRLPDRAASFSAPVVSSCRLKVVVTGASGKAGRAVVRDLIDHDYEVHAVDVVPPGESQATFLLADVTDFEQTVECLPGVDAVVHLAAIPAPGIHTVETTFRTNMLSESSATFHWPHWDSQGAEGSPLVSGPIGWHHYGAGIEPILDKSHSAARGIVRCSYPPP